MNQAVFLALLQPGDTFMGLDLNAGGHLTHGSPVNMSGKWFKVVPYGVRADDQRIDMDEVARLARAAKPKLIIAGGTAYSRFWDWQRFREIADEVGAYLMVDMAHIAGLVAGGVHPSPVPHAHVVTSTTHKSLRGPARRPDPDQRRGDRQEDQFGRVPGPAGRAADARHRGQGGGVRRGAAARVQGLRHRPWSTTPRCCAETIKAGGYDIVAGGTDNHLHAGRSQRRRT